MNPPLFSIVITYQLTMISSNIEVFANHPLLHFYVMGITFISVLCIALILLRFVQRLFISKKK